MKEKLTILQRITILFSLALFITSCSGITKATDIFTKPTAKEIYQREVSSSAEVISLWEEQAALALTDSVSVQLPYAEEGRFFPNSFPVYSYEVAANPGENLLVEVQTDSSETLVFLDLFKHLPGSPDGYKHLKSAQYNTTFLEQEIAEPGIYKIVVQPQIEANSGFQLRIETAPVYQFPIAGKGNTAIQSFWGANRDGGRRSHEGIDIFAARGTPVVATTEGRVTRTGNKGLGGKQVWLRDRKRGLSLYYAHLDSIIASPGMQVAPGDTLGLVGNTGNARNTPPHLHFGIYKGYSGAVNPLPYVFQSEKAQPLERGSEWLKNPIFISKRTANLRKGPSTRSQVLGQLSANDTLKVLGKTQSWYHIRSNDRASFIHESLVAPL